MATLNRHLGWIQLLFMIGGLVFIYGQQVQTGRDIERRTTQCEVNIREQNVANRDLVNAIGELKVEIKGLQTEIKYLSRRGRAP